MALLDWGLKKDRDNIARDLSRRFGWICWYCGLKLDIGFFSLDHIVPRSLGGHDGIGNLALCCITCNRAKFDSHVEDFKAWIEQVKLGPYWYAPIVTIRKKRKRKGRKLTEQEVSEIKDMLGLFSGVYIAEQFYVSPKTISDIKRECTWGHVVI